MSFDVRFKMNLHITIRVVSVSFLMLTASAQAATVFVTRDPLLPFGALTNPTASVTLDSSVAILRITALNSVPSQLELFELLGDNSRRLIFTVSSAPVVGVFSSQFGSEGLFYASYVDSFSASIPDINALESGSVALLATYQDGSSQSHIFEIASIPEPSVVLMSGLGALALSLHRKRKRTRRIMQPLPAVQFR